MWDGIDQAATDQALAYRARNPTPPPAAKPSAWAQAGELLAAPFKGIGQGALQTARNVNAAAGVSGVSNIDPREDLAGYLEDQRLSREGAKLADPLLRGGVDRLKPDPVTSTTASQILQDMSRVLTKAGGYAVIGGVPGGVIGTGFDEGVTGYLELRDKGVDPATAAKAGAVRGAAMAVGLAAPVAGRTMLQSAAIFGVTGPGTFMAEQALTRDILERADYPELAAQYDPFDPVGLGVSLLVPAAFGGAVHLRRARAGRQSAEAIPADVSPGAVLADMPEVIDAAHVAYRSQTLDAAMLGDRGDPQVRTSHVQALDDAGRAMESGEPVRIAALDVDPVKAQRVSDEVASRLRTVEAEWGALRGSEPEAPAGMAAEPLSAEQGQPDATGRMQSIVEQVRQVLGLETAPRPLQAPSEPSAPMQRAARIAEQRPQMPVRMDDGEPPSSAGDLLHSVREEDQRSRTDKRAFEAAVECFLRTGS